MAPDRQLPKGGAILVCPPHALIFFEVRVTDGLTGWYKFDEVIVWSCVAAAIPTADFVLQMEELCRSRATPAKAARPAAQAA